MEEEQKLKALKIFLRIYGILSLIIFVPLFALFIVQSPLLAVGGPLNWMDYLERRRV